MADHALPEWQPVTDPALCTLGNLAGAGLREPVGPFGRREPEGQRSHIRDVAEPEPLSGRGSVASVVSAAATDDDEQRPTTPTGAMT
jgi:hypothetical protein